MEPKVESHSQSMAAGQPPICAPSSQQEHAYCDKTSSILQKRKIDVTLSRFFSYYRAEQGRPGNALRFFQAFVKGLTEWPVPAPDFTCYGKDCVECPWTSFHQAFIGIIYRIKQRDE